MTPPDTTPPRDPWWASGRTPTDGLDGGEDPFDAHREARRGADDQPTSEDGPATATGGESARLAGDAVDLVARLAAEAGRRVAARATANAAGPAAQPFARDGEASDGPRGAAGAGTFARILEGIAPHEDGEVCDACPVCIGLRALRQARPEVVVHLADAAHHLSLALRAFADAQAGGTDGLEKIDLDR